MYFTPDWTPIPDFASYGYGLGISNLLAKAARHLGPEIEQASRPRIRSMVDCVLRHGWDFAGKGFHYGGSTYGRTHVEDLTIFIAQKYWWVQAEGTRALLRSAQESPDGELDYQRRFDELWHYIKTKVIDRRHGGWRHIALGSFGRRRRMAKGTVWKEPSHEVLSLLECLRLLGD
jgi:mannose/cellobiose epimerase-like protein (N-acyl-D-glucosamine 2-epimerase family)